MSIEAVAQSIQMIIAPTVMVSTCTLVLNGILGRYGEIGNRIRALVRERAEFLASNDVPVRLYDQAVSMIDRQLINLAHRHRLLQYTALMIYGAILLFLLSMFVIAIARLSDAMSVATIALILFLLGTGSLSLSVILTSFEVHVSHRAIHTEMKWIMTLVKGGV
ncbi:DUF2721 domain-containing protein [Leptolyngbya sp. NIES-2104]|uniref:DUF2721 domain-containing protein n=1 Tax=Leptolyngbya sp. NIES-2104 TaxID=1552121 RepID=UPI0006ECA19A|nr:DUF2721 domain-containing protein [Leptolyngbya sp. NIES-2104]GAQ00019.1 hypothetical protein NIES2104_65840 [Leptolyngbya sp. NIES-2104]